MICRRVTVLRLMLLVWCSALLGVWGCSSKAPSEKKETQAEVTPEKVADAGGDAQDADGDEEFAGSMGDRSALARQRMVRENGGNERSEQAVQAGLQWLIDHQAPDGHWSIDGFQRVASCSCVGAANKENDVAGTAFGLLPLLASGETHRESDQSGRYIKNMQRGVAFLLGKQTPQGDFGSGTYAHALATIALCEAFNMTSDPALKEPTQKAVDYIVKGQHAGGGWRYHPGQPGDTSVTSWQLMALKSAQMAGLSFPPETLRRGSRFLRVVGNANDDGYGYLPGTKTTTPMTAAGLLCAQYLQGRELQTPNIMKRVARLKREPPTRTLTNMYYYYYATQVMFNVGGEDWNDWNTKMRDLLVDTQDKGNNAKHAHQKGSWGPAGDPWARGGGRMMTTSMALLTLEVYYRYLPLNRQLSEMVKDSKDNPNDSVGAVTPKKKKKK